MRILRKAKLLIVFLLFTCNVIQAGNGSMFHALLTISSSSTDTNAQGQQAFLVIGDSIAKGTSASVGPTPTDGTAYYYRRSNNTVIEIDNQDLILADVANRPNVGSPWPQFAINYNLIDTSKKAVIIPTAVGASNFANQGVASDCWDPTVSGSLYDTAVMDAQACMSVMGVTKLKGIIIILGINDARGTVGLDTTQAAIDSFFVQIQIDFPNVPIMVYQIGRSEVTTVDARIGAVRQYLKTVCENNTNVVMMGTVLAAEGAGYVSGGDIHLTQAGNNEAGKSAARWHANPSYSKWAREIIASHFDDLSTTRKDLIEDLITGNLTAYLNHEGLFNLKTTIIENCYLDWAFLCCPPSGLSFTFSANSHIAGNGTSFYFRSNYVQSFLNLVSSQNDFFKSSKVLTSTTAAGTGATLFGNTDAAAIRTSISQSSGSQINYVVNDFTVTAWASGDTKFQAASEYLIARNGGNKYLYKNGSQVHTAAVASTGINAKVQSELAFLNNVTVQGWLNAEIQDIRHGKFTAVDPATFYAAMETLRAGW